jgi:tetratricopeptide (TPR) repeat protein
MTTERTAPGNPPTSIVVKSRRRRWLGAGLVGVVLLAAGFWYVRRPPPPPQPPSVPLTDLDPEVAQVITEASAAVAKAPRSARAWGRLGMVLAVHEFHAEALEALAEAERLDPHDPRWPYLEGKSLQLSEPERAIPKLRRAAEISSVPAVQVRLARLLLSEGRLDEAEGFFRKAAQNDSNDGRAWVGLAQVARARGKLDDCVNDLRHAVEQPGTRKAAHTMLAEVYAQFPERQAEAEKERDLGAHLPDDPPPPDPYSQEALDLRVGKRARIERAYQMRQAGQFREAVTLLQDTLRQYPDFDLAYLALGEALLDRGDFPNAEPVLRKAVELAPDRYESHLALGITLYQERTSRPELLNEAEEHFRVAIRLFPTQPQAHYGLGTCLQARHLWAEAAVAYANALRNRPDYSEARRNLRQVLIEIAQLAAPAAWFAKPQAANDGTTAD